MRPTFRDMKRQMRGVVHETMAEPVLYLVGMSAVAGPVTARLHTSIQALGALAGGDGFAEVDAITPRIVFMNAQVTPRMNDIIIFKDVGAYQIGNVLPADDITTTAEVALITKANAIKAGWVPTLPWMGLPAPSNA